jgi:hypothetical protein
MIDDHSMLGVTFQHPRTKGLTEDVLGKDCRIDP